MRRILAVLLIGAVLGAGLFYYRSKNAPVLDKDGNPLRYTYEELEEEGRTGVFVHNADDTFSPAIRTMPGYEGETEEADPARYLWYVETDKSIDELIPTVIPGAE